LGEYGLAFGDAGHFAIGDGEIEAGGAEVFGDAGAFAINSDDAGAEASLGGFGDGGSGSESEVASVCWRGRGNNLGGAG